MPAAARLTVLCLATFEKGAPFMQACHALGCRVLLVTLDTLSDAPSWPRDVLDEVFYLIVASPSRARVTHLTTEYAERFTRDFYAFAPAPDTPAH